MIVLTTLIGAVRTRVFLALRLAQLGVGPAIRSPHQGLALRSRSLEAALLLAALLQVAAETSPRDLGPWCGRDDGGMIGS